MTDAALAPGARVLERYRLEASIPSRLAGEAWLAEDPERGARVEVHLLAATAERERAFPQVRQAIERLAGAQPRGGGGLARPLALEWSEDGRLVLVLEYHDGRSLASLLAQRPARSEEAREVLRGVLHALASATRLGLAHGRLTPARILLGAENQVALLDVGIAPLLELSSDDAPWLAPGEARGARADAYAVAVIAMELLSGQRPERGQPLPEVPPEAAAAVGKPFLEAIQRLARADGSAQVFDAGALLGLLPPRLVRARRSRYTLSEVWDGDIGSGTARLMKLAVSPEYHARMPDEIRGQKGDDDGDGPDELKFLTTLPGVFVARSAAPAPEPEPAPAAELERTLPPKHLAAPAPQGAAPPSPPSAVVTDIEVTRPPPGVTSSSSVPTMVQTMVLPRGGKPDPAPPPLSIKVTAAAPKATVGPLAVRSGAQQATFVIPITGPASVGRERGNDLVLRAFKGTEVDGVDSNRVSRRHLTLNFAAGAFTVTDETSAYGTSLDGRRLKPGEGLTLPTGAGFGLHLAGTVLAFRGRAWPLTGALRLVREDGTGHHYLLLMGPAGSAVRVGSSQEEDALLVPGARPGHALLRLDPRSGALQISPGEGPVTAGGTALARGAWADLHPGSIELSGARLPARALASPYDFFSPSGALSF